MDSRTLDFYRANASEVACRYEEGASPIAGRITQIFLGGGRILDVGCRSGRGLAVREIEVHLNRGRSRKNIFQAPPAARAKCPLITYPSG
jgi:hypothetical protein